MKLLIIGGTGVLSTAVVREALNNSIEVTIINRGHKSHLVPKTVRLLKADIHDEKKVLALLNGEKFDTVIDFICFNEEQIAYSLRLFGPYVAQYIFISTTCVYNTENEGLLNEDSAKILSVWDYSVNKWKAEEYLRRQAKEQSIPFTIIRPCITYDNTRIPYGIVPPYGYHWTIIERIFHNKPIITWDGGNAKWNIMRVEDFAVGVIGLIGNLKAIGEAYNISGDDSYTWKEILDTVGRLLNRNIVTFDISSDEYAAKYPEKFGEIKARSLNAEIDNRKIKGLIPTFKSKIGLEEGLSMTLEYYKKNGYIYGIDYAFEGGTDRIINYYARKRGIKIPNLHFIDYLGNASLYDRLRYWIAYNKSNPIGKVLYWGVLFIKKLRKISRL